MKLKAFWKNNKETILFSYITIVTIVAILAILYGIVMSEIAGDLATVVQIREQEIGGLAFDMDYQNRSYEELDEELRICKERKVEE
jgi:hypothetical protein